MRISKKAYTDFVARFHNTFIGSAKEGQDIITSINNDYLYEEAVKLLDEYLKCGKICLHIPHSTRDINVAFMMILPEIDRAIARSAAARKRARLRKERKAAEAAKAAEEAEAASIEIAEDAASAQPTLPEPPATVTLQAPATSVTAPRPLPPPTVMHAVRMNRRERRAYERELARKSRHSSPPTVQP